MSEPLRVPGRTPQQRAAGPANSVWVQASAGTGKTKVLTDRVLALMLAGCDPGRILCLTFTKAAAAEMAIRLNRRLAEWTVAEAGKLAQDIQDVLGIAPDEDLRDRARRLLARVLDQPGGMKIVTIHSFCQSLLGRFPLEAGVAPHFEVMEERVQQAALAEARDAVLNTARGATGGALAAALAKVAARINEDDFAALMSALTRDRVKLEAALGDGFKARLCRLLGVQPEDEPDAIVAAACRRGVGDERALAAAAKRLGASGNKPSDQKQGVRLAAWLAAGAARAELFDDYARAFFTVEGEPRKALMTKDLAAAAPGELAALAAERTRLAGVLAHRAAAELKEASQALATLGGAILERYRRYKEDRALLDYDDLVLGAGRLLRRAGIAPWVLYKLDGGLDHVLIDEAQDTNPDQWQVIAALAEEFFVGASARDVPRTVFAVGDGKQSIFSFQGAKPDAFREEMRQHFAARAGAAWDEVQLDRSFRSVPAVLQAVDAVFAQAAAAPGVVGPRDAPLRHVADRAKQPGLVELWPPAEPEELPELVPWEPPLEQRRETAAAARLARAIAAKLRQWIGKERLASRGRLIEAGDVMVLVRRRTGFVVELIRALKNQGIAVAGSDRMRLTEQLAVEDMLALLQFLLLPEDDLTLATVLKGPLVGFDDDRLMRLAVGRGRASLWSVLRARAGETAEFAAAAELLGTLLGRADFAPPYELMAEILGAHGGRRKMLARLGTEANDPLDELLAAALAYERTAAPSIQGFVHWLAAGDIEVKRDLDQRGRDEVRIMTVHGAKGLQAPIVFLPDTMQAPIMRPSLLWAQGLPLWRTPGGDAPALVAALAEADQLRDEEYRRLLYVAMTRAEDRLYLCGWNTKRAPPEQYWHKFVAAGLEAAGATPFAFDLRPLLGDDGWTGPGLRLQSQDDDAPPKSDREVRPAPDAYSLPATIHNPPPPEPAPPRPLAPSRPAAAEPAPRSPLGEDRGASFQRGRLVHRLLQSLPLLPPSERAAAARRFLALPVHGLDPAAQARIRAETLAVLEDPALAAVFGPDSQAEVAVVGLVGKRAISGRIDRLVVGPDDILIVDYKTQRPAPPSEDLVPALYVEQLAAYRGAIAAIYPGRPVRCALLWTDGPRLMPIGPARLDLAQAAF